VVVTGWGLGELYWGGLAQLAKVRPDWLVPLPEGLTPQQAMAVGTAGFTAMLCIEALEQKGLTPDFAKDRPILVTGATGGVGSFAVAMLSSLGYRVAASTGRTGDDARRYLSDLGAAEITGRISPGKPLDTERWAGAVDTVGGETLAALLGFLAENSSVAACGLAGGFAVPATIFPFILRGVSLLGVNSVAYPAKKRPAIWKRIVEAVPPDVIDRMTHSVIPLSEVPTASEQMLANTFPGRVVVEVTPQ
jgi:acrylyl-CoA reductase (NADPH)